MGISEALEGVGLLWTGSKQPKWQHEDALIHHNHVSAQASWRRLEKACARDLDLDAAHQTKGQY